MRRPVCKLISCVFCCDFGVPGDCSQGSNASGQCDKASQAFAAVSARHPLLMRRPVSKSHRLQFRNVSACYMVYQPKYDSDGTTEMSEEDGFFYVLRDICSGPSLNGSCVLVGVFFHELPCQAEHATAWWLPQVV